MESAAKDLRVIRKVPYRTIHTVEKKLELVKRVENGEKVAAVCSKEKVKEVVLSKWIEDKSKLENLVETKVQTHMNVILAHNVQKNMRLMNDKIEDGLYSWYMACTKNGSQIRNRNIASKAKELNRAFGGSSDFTATPSFVASWKKKYKIETKLLSRQQKKDQTVLEHFRERLLEIIEDDGLTNQQVFICGELKIDYKTLPTKESITHEFEGKDSTKNILKKGSEISSEQLSIMFCSNTTGTLKLPLMVIGNSMISSNEELPVYYKYRDRDLIGGHAFEEWQKEKGMPCVRKFLKDQNLSSMALLLVSHFYTSGKIVGFNEKIAYLPPNASCITESFNLKVLNELKLRFWLKIFSYVLESRECGFDATDMKLEEVLHLLDEAWNETSVDAFSYFWDFLPGDKHIKMVGENINLLSQLISLIKRFYDEKNDKCPVKEVETIEIDSEESEMKDEVEEIGMVYLDSEGRETNCKRESKTGFKRGKSKTNFERRDANFVEEFESSFPEEEVRSSFQEDELQSRFQEEEVHSEFEEEEIKITLHDTEKEKTESNKESQRVPCVKIDEIKTEINSFEDSNITREECITSLKTAIQFFKSRNKYGEFSKDIKLLRSLVIKACDIDIEMDTN